MQHVLKFLELAAGVGRFIFQNRPESLAFECHVIVLSALARAAMLGNKVLFAGRAAGVVPLVGLEPTAPGLKVRCSARLS